MPSKSADTGDRQRHRGNGRDAKAGQIVQALRKSQGASREDFINLVADRCVAAGYSRAKVEFSTDLLDLIEKHGHEPGPRIIFAISLACGVRPGQIWKAYDFKLPFEVPMPQERVAA